ncbi:Fic family protein [Cellulomonas algicola]|uniref:Fic family protein n=1 Tax=Cellulomonas algicola TaxID=2071633 RepID=UPI001C3F8A24|nr:Fic family protein [Cellulomonas algicola]
MPADPLAPLVDLPGVADAVDAARVACEGLRWHEAYRRRWREVRAEAGLRSARASAAVDGARVTLDVVRGLATGAAPHEPGGPALPGRPDPHVERVLGAVRAAAVVERLMPDLGARGSATLPPLPQLLARLHAAAATGWLDDDAVGRVRGAGAPQDLTGLGPAPAGEEVVARLDLLGRAVATTRAPALVVAAVVHGELLTLRPFAAGNGVVARAASRLLVTARGLDPTGSVVAETGSAATPQAYLGAAAGFATGTPDGVAAWVRACAGAVVDGVERARHVADGVLAGHLPAD